MVCCHPANLLDLNLFENIWCHMKAVIAKDHCHITSFRGMSWLEQDLWDNYADEKWDDLIASMPE